MAPGTEFAPDFCAAIGPLQLGVVLVIDYYHRFSWGNVYLLMSLFTRPIRDFQSQGQGENTSLAWYPLRAP